MRSLGHFHYRALYWLLEGIYTVEPLWLKFELDYQGAIDVGL